MGQRMASVMVRHAQAVIIIEDPMFSRTKNSGPARITADPQMAESERGGRRETATGGEGHPARGSRITAAGEHLSSLRLRPVGRSMAETPCERCHVLRDNLDSHLDCRAAAMVIVRYADDTVVGFEHRADAERFLANLRIRMTEFDLELHPDKNVTGQPSVATKRHDRVPLASTCSGWLVRVFMITGIGVHDRTE
jgi:hypothetical protein